MYSRRLLKGALLSAFIVLISISGVSVHAAEDFVDINALEATNSIRIICDQGIMQGVDNRHFAPQAAVSRAQLATVLYRVFQFSAADQAIPNDIYMDMEPGAWYADAVIACASNGVFVYSDQLAPLAQVSRIEVASCIYRALAAQNVGLTISVPYPDLRDITDLSAEERMAAIALNNAGIMQGQDGLFRPQEGINRAELAMALLKVVEASALSKANSGEEYRLLQGQSFVVSLPANAGTGYQWQLVDRNNSDILSLVSSNYLPDNDQLGGHQAPMVGSGGKQLWKFRAEKAGSYTLQLSYSRPWESVTPIDSFTLKVLISDPQQRVGVTTKRIVSQSEYLQSLFMLPVIQGMSNTKAQEKLNQESGDAALKIYDELLAGATAEKAEMERNNATVKGTFRPYELDIRYTLTRSTDRWISYYQDVYCYTGGAHGMTVRSSLNLDVQAGQKIKIGDLFRDDYDYRTVIEQEIRRQIALKADQYSNGGSDFTGIDEESFYITQNGLVFYFQIYELAPYARGIVEFTIPFDLVKTGLRIKL